MNMSPAGKLAVGVFAILSKVFAVILFLIGMFALGIGSAIIAFLFWAVVIAGVIAAIISFGVWLWKTIKDAGGFKAVMTAIWTKIKEKTVAIWNRIKEKIGNVWGKIKDNIRERMMAIKEFLGEKWGAIKENIAEGWDKVKTKLKEKWTALKEAFITYLITPLKNAWVTVINWIIDKVNFLIRQVNRIPGVSIGEIGKLGNRQTGGFIPHTGLYKLHAGESVSPAGSMTINFMPTITVSATSNVDIDQLKTQLSDELARDVTDIIRR